MAFYQLPHPWDPGYAIPKYVMAEPPGRGTFTTKWLPRGTISELVPDYIAKPVAKKLTGRNDATLGSLGGSSLGDEVYALVPTGGVMDQMALASIVVQLRMACTSPNVTQQAVNLFKSIPPEQRQQAAQMVIASGGNATCVHKALEAANGTPWMTYALVGAGALVLWSIVKRKK